MFGLSAIECFIAIVFIFIVLFWITPKKLSGLPILLTVVLLSVLAYNIVPNESDDLSRYFMQLDYLRDYGYDYLKRCFEDNVNGGNWGTYRVCGYYFYFISWLPSNQWMPAITVFLSYGLLLLVIYKMAKRFNVSKFYLFFAVIFFLSTYWYYDVCSGIRNGLTFSIIFSCAYYHLAERKNIALCYLGYILASLLHSSGIMLVALVLLAVVTLNTSGKFMNFLLVFGVSGGAALMQFLAAKTDNSFVQSIAGQAEKHQPTAVIPIGTMFFVNIAVYIVVCLIFIYFSNYILQSHYASDMKRFYKYSSIILYFMIGCLYSMLIFIRIARWIIPAIGAMFYMIGSQLQKEYIDKNGESYCRYYAPSKEIVSYKLKPFFNILLFGFTAVHFWYLCAGSSLNWMHF